MSFFSFSLFSILSLARLGVRKRDISRHTHAQIMTASLIDENRMPPVDTIDKKKKAYCLRISWILVSKIIRNLLFLNTIVKNNNRRKDLLNKIRIHETKFWNSVIRRTILHHASRVWHDWDRQKKRVPVWLPSGVYIVEPFGSALAYRKFVGARRAQRTLFRECSSCRYVVFSKIINDTRIRSL